MDKAYDRREILKLLTLFPAIVTNRNLNPNQGFSSCKNKKNMLIIVFDAFSACNIPFYGYLRNTTPKTSEILNRAVVYHNHYAGGPFTTPGTATLLTGVLPWTHRANKIHNKVIAPYNQLNIFSEFKSKGYFNISYTHNPLVDTLLQQFNKYIDQNIPRRELMIRTGWGSGMLPKDSDLVDILQRNILLGNEGMNDSLFLGKYLSKDNFTKRQKIRNDYKESFPRGLPRSGSENFFTLETAIDWNKNHIKKFPRPYFGYFHYIPPHHPYHTRSEFIHLFNDELHFINKPAHILVNGKSQNIVDTNRMFYDQTIAYVDSEFRRLFDWLDEEGILEDTWLVLTSDHGEMFERGIVGHSTNTLYQPVVKIPLIIFEPGRKKQLNIYKKTSAIDILPTLMHITGHETPMWCDGQVLPPYNEDGQYNNIYAVMAQKTPTGKPLTTATVMMIKEQYKLIYYWGYEKLDYKDLYELYNLEEDPEELNDEYSPNSTLAKKMIEELKNMIFMAEQPYKK